MRTMLIILAAMLFAVQPALAKTGHGGTPYPENPELVENADLADRFLWAVEEVEKAQAEVQDAQLYIRPAEKRQALEKLAAAEERAAELLGELAGVDPGRVRELRAEGLDWPAVVERVGLDPQALGISYLADEPPYSEGRENYPKMKVD
jgi:hypothetical protein